jgi:hypothetical protein
MTRASAPSLPQEWRPSVCAFRRAARALLSPMSPVYARLLAPAASPLLWEPPLMHASPFALPEDSEPPLANGSRPQASGEAPPRGSTSMPDSLPGQKPAEPLTGHVTAGVHDRRRSAQIDVPAGTAAAGPVLPLRPTNAPARRAGPKAAATPSARALPPDTETAPAGYVADTTRTWHGPLSAGSTVRGTVGQGADLLESLAQAALAVTTPRDSAAAGVDATDLAPARGGRLDGATSRKRDWPRAPRVPIGGGDTAPASSEPLPATPAVPSATVGGWAVEAAHMPSGAEAPAGLSGSAATPRAIAPLRPTRRMASHLALLDALADQVMDQADAAAWPPARSTGNPELSPDPAVSAVLPGTPNSPPGPSELRSGGANGTGGQAVDPFAPAGATGGADVGSVRPADQFAQSAAGISPEWSAAPGQHPDPAEAVAALVNEALARQARLHGVDLS